MADEDIREETEEEEDKEKKGKSGIKAVLASPIILVAIVLLAQAGIALVMVNMIGGDGDSAEGVEIAGNIEEEAGKNEDEGDKPERGKIISLDNIVVNLRENNELYYLKLAVGLEIENSEMEEEIKAREPNLRDIIIEHVSSRRVSDLDTIEERNAMKKELHMKINNALRTGDLIQLYFSEFVIQ
jgi:flagellar FliL protein